MQASLLDEAVLASFSETVRRFTEERLTLARWRRLVDSAQGYAPADWLEMAELGWHALPLDPAHGGLGGGAPMGGFVASGTLGLPGTFPGGGASGAGNPGGVAYNGAAGASGLAIIRW